MSLWGSKRSRPASAIGSGSLARISSEGAETPIGLTKEHARDTPLRTSEQRVAKLLDEVRGFSGDAYNHALFGPTVKAAIDKRRRPAQAASAFDPCGAFSQSCNTIDKPHQL